YSSKSFFKKNTLREITPQANDNIIKDENKSTSQEDILKILKICKMMMKSY
ncbi:9164_t:CDS:1, partial [Cetraspora pellucida]